MNAHRRPTHLWLIAAVVLLLGAVAIQPVAAAPAGSVAARQHAYTGCGGAIAPLVNADFEQQLVELINQERAKQGLPPLKRTSDLTAAARYHGTDMGQDDYFKHDTYDRGVTEAVCSWTTRVGNYYASHLYIAENLAAGQATPKQVVEAWMNSEGHRDNILNPNVWEIGTGYFQGAGQYGRYWAADFGKRTNVYPLMIDRDAESSYSRSVSLYVYGSWTEIQVRINGGAWSTWQPFHAPMNWTLPAGLTGTVKIEVQVRSGNAVYPTILFDTILMESLDDYAGTAFLPIIKR